jgi:hypothetical protein
MITRARDAFLRGELLNEFVPVPEALKIVAGRVGDDTDPEQIKLHEQTQNNLSVYGYATWYDFCVNEWGTKWDVGGNDCNEPEGDELNITMDFDSAWAPPLTAYEKLMDLGFGVRGYYYESGMCFCGIWDNGDDDYYDISGMTAAEVADTIPAELDDGFGISETIAHYEDQEEAGRFSATDEEDDEPDNIMDQLEAAGGVVIGGGVNERFSDADKEDEE